MNPPPTRSRLLRPFVLLVWLLLCAAPAAGDEASVPAPPHPLTPELELAYGNRAKFFRSVPPAYRPDLDWRSALSESLATAEPRWSQGFEELVIRDFFGDRTEGIYVDVGCYKARVNSTTYALEEDLGWTGIGIDVMPRHRRSWEQFRPRSKFVQAAVADTDGEKLELHIASPFVTLDDEMAKTLKEEHNLKAKTIEVESSTLDTILERQGIERFDFLSMDIEGAELAALKGFDIQRFRPALCAVETTKREQVVEYFDSNGYELIEKYLKADKVNFYFRPKTPGP